MCLSGLVATNIVDLKLRMMSTKLKICLFDSSQALCQSDIERFGGLNIRIHTQDRFRNISEWLEEVEPDIVIVHAEVSLVRVAISKIRESIGAPILFIPRSDCVREVWEGIQFGVDDFLMQPINFDELLIRIRSLENKRRLYLPKRKEFRLKKGNLTIDPNERLVHINNEQLELTDLEYKLIIVLVESQGAVMSKSQIYRRVFSREYSPFDRSLDTHLCNLRKKLEKSNDGFPKIKTIRGVGYALCP